MHFRLCPLRPLLQCASLRGSHALTPINVPGALDPDSGPGLPEFLSTYAFGINNRGQIVGWYPNTHGSSGFLYSGGSFTPINDPEASLYTTALGINDRGQIVHGARES